MLQAYISNYQEKYDRLHHLVSPQRFTCCTNLIAIQQTSRNSDISRSFENDLHQHLHHGNPWPQGLRATVSQNSLYLDSQEAADLYEDTMLPMGPPKSNYEQRQIDTDHLVWLTPKKNIVRPVWGKYLSQLWCILRRIAGFMLYSYTHTAIK